MPFEDILYLFNSCYENRNYVRLNLLEAGLLFRIASIAPGDILEIGTKFGGSAVLMACAVNDDRKVHSVDVISHIDHIRGKGLAELIPEHLSHKIDFIVDDSIRAASKWNSKLGMIFIDGGHMADALSNDIDAWCPHLLTGGYIAFHDIGAAGTKYECLAEVVKKKLPMWKTIEYAQSMLVLQKVE